MGVYVITDGEGSYIYRDEATNKYVPIKSFKHALRWDSILKANTILNSQIPKRIKNNFAVQFVTTDDSVEKNDVSVHNKICFRNIEDDNIDDWVSKINIIVDVFSNFDARQAELNEKLSKIDKEKIDIEHYIEFGKFNAYQGWLCFKMLQNVLRQRRKYKNEIEVLNLIKQFEFDKDSISAIPQTIFQLLLKTFLAPL